MKGKILTYLSFIIIFAVNQNVFAQSSCSTESRTALKDCFGNAAESCRTAVPQCAPFEPGITVADVRILAIDKCCRKSSLTLRQTCLKRERRFYQPTIAGLPGQFFRAARNAIDDVKKNICGSTTYTIPQDSALF